MAENMNGGMPPMPSKNGGMPPKNGGMPPMPGKPGGKPGEKNTELSADELRDLMKKNNDAPRGPHGRNMV
ncbi:MAG: hypothetical protein IJY35_00250, partial [Clostridia bacterium]|nr:hypothetical protein [Clostridia bacterium]